MKNKPTKNKTEKTLKNEHEESIKTREKNYLKKYIFLNSSVYNYFSP